MNWIVQSWNKAISLYRYTGARAIVSVAIVRLTINVVKTDLLIVTGKGKKKYRKIRFLILYGLFEQTQIYSNKKKERRRKKNKRKEKFMELLNDIILIYCE